MVDWSKFWFNWHPRINLRQCLSKNLLFLVQLDAQVGGRSWSEADNAMLEDSLNSAVERWRTAILKNNFIKIRKYSKVFLLFDDEIQKCLVFFTKF